MGELQKAHNDLQKLNEKLSVMAERDSLTGLYNRRKIDELINYTLDDSERTGQPVSLIMADIDHFKQVNDTYGHDIGDQVLIEVGRRLNSLEPGAVTAVRIGGDEFVLILEAQEGADIRAAAGRIAEELCVLMDEPVKTDEADIVPTACTGIGIWPDDAEDIDSLYQITDEAMYGIKHNSDKSSYSFINESQAEQK
jgi:diguanylate cyclase (GGDEF)-like protein